MTIHIKNWHDSRFIVDETELAEQTIDRLRAQRLANYWRTAVVEHIALERKPPYYLDADGFVRDIEHRLLELFDPLADKARPLARAMSAPRDFDGRALMETGE